MVRKILAALAIAAAGALPVSGSELSVRAGVGTSSLSSNATERADWDSLSGEFSYTDERGIVRFRVLDGDPGLPAALYDTLPDVPKPGTQFRLDAERRLTGGPGEAGFAIAGAYWDGDDLPTSQVLPIRRRGEGGQMLVGISAGSPLLDDGRWHYSAFLGATAEDMIDSIDERGVIAQHRFGYEIVPTARVSAKYGTPDTHLFGSIEARKYDSSAEVLDHDADPGIDISRASRSVTLDSDTVLLQCALGGEHRFANGVGLGLEGTYRHSSGKDVQTRGPRSGNDFDADGYGLGAYVRYTF